MIFFDLDDTLFDFKEAERLAVEASYVDYGVENYSVEQFYDNWCKIGQDLYAKYLRREMTFDQLQMSRIYEVLHSVGISADKSKLTELFQIHAQNYEESWMAFQDVVPCLEQLQSFRLGIISNGDQELQRKKLVKLGIAHYFEFVITSGEVGVSKPDRRIFELACERTGTMPEKCYYIGDSLETDILPCMKAGWNGIWLDRRNRGTEMKDIMRINQLYDLENIVAQNMDREIDNE